jgi:hypothetical protein
MSEQGSAPQSRLLFLLHRGCVEARLLAMAGRHQQLIDLTDLLEVIPTYLMRWQDGYVELLASGFAEYEASYRGQCFEYLRILDGQIGPDF